MMREILFRGKYRYCNEWLYGDLTHGAPHGEEPMIRTHDRELNGVFAVETDTVGQYTGITDKNGKRIFEGDIVECWSEGVCARGTVQQRKDGMWIIYPAWQKYIMWGLCPDEHLHTTVEVIGNIHDNPELVEIEDEEEEDKICRRSRPR